MAKKSANRRQWDGAWEQLQEERRKAPIERLGDRLRISPSVGVPPGRAYLIAPRGQQESEAEWLARCARVTNVDVED